MNEIEYRIYFNRFDEHRVNDIENDLNTLTSDGWRVISSSMPNDYQWYFLLARTNPEWLEFIERKNMRTRRQK